MIRWLIAGILLGSVVGCGAKEPPPEINSHPHLKKLPPEVTGDPESALPKTKKRN